MPTKLAIPVSTHLNDSYRSGEQYGDWSEDHSLKVGDAAIIIQPNDKNYLYSYEYETYEGDLQEGDIVYAVIANWSTGDSFGRSSGGSYEVCSITKDKDRAWRNVKALNGPIPARNGRGIFQDRWSVTLELDNGTTMQYFRSWLGYFESLDSIDVYDMIVETKVSDDE